LPTRTKISIFGTSAKYLAALEQAGVKPGDFDLSSLRAILSTGSPLAGELRLRLPRD
jgi:acetoacetyl-CoA synthetase